MLYTMDSALPILKQIMAENRLSIFAGSGISVDSGLPAWDGFIDKYIDICEQLNESLEPEMQFSEIITDAKKKKEDDLISTVTALKDKVRECKDQGVNTDFVDDKLNYMFYSARPNEYHDLIVSTNYKYIITTNYDSLLEAAASEQGYKSLTTRSYSYTEGKNLSRTVYSGKTAIIHAHGKISDLKLDQFVLTKDDYLGIMKHNGAFRLIINSIFLTTSVLFVGYGGSDPHFEDIISDLNMTLKWNGGESDLPRCFIMLKEDKITPIRKFLNDKQRVDVISFDDYPQMKEFLKVLATEFPRIK